LIYYDPSYRDTGYYGLHLTKRYWVFRHFTKAAPAGAFVRKVATAAIGPEVKWRAIAFDYPERGQLYSIVAMNAQDAPGNLHLQGDTGSVLPKPRAIYVTHENANWEEAGAAASVGAGNSIELLAPELSIYTILF